MKVVIGGGTGMIGQALAQNLVMDGHEVVILTRQQKAASKAEMKPQVRFAIWDGRTAGEWVSELESADAVVNLVGENLSNSLWTRKQKERIISSRVNAGKAFSEAFTEIEHKPAVFVQASGAGAYGISEEKMFTETDDYGQDFLAGVTTVWEGSTRQIEEMGVRRVITRSGVVLEKGKGALRLMLLPFRMWVGGPLGSGKQWISWIHLEDEVRAIRFLIENENARGVYNLSAEPVTNAAFAKAVSRAMHRPSWFRIPRFAMKFVLGEMSTMVLDGQNVSTEKIQSLGFKFLYPKIDDALRNLL
jgi:uncharacterized protein (TIGR01777 family)